MSTHVGERDKDSKEEKKKLKVFMLSSKFGGGKDFMRSVIFNILKSHGHSPLAISFADHFKLDCVAKDKVDYAKVFGNDRDEITRTLLQRRGTEQGINVYGKQIWCSVAEAWIRVQFERGCDYFIIADCRFGHELEWALNHPEIEAHIIRLIASKRTWDRAMKEAAGNEEMAKRLCSHRSETDLDDTPECKWSEKFHLIVDNDYGQEKESVRLVSDFVNKVLA